MNWKLRVDYFRPLSQDDLVLFAPPAEVVRAAASYNAALQQYVAGEEEAAKKRLLQICSDFPLFAQAGHLCGVLLAASGDYELAETLLKRVRLLELSEEEAAQLDDELSVLHVESQRLRREKARLRRREALLQPVKAEIALRSILKRAPDDKNGRFLRRRKADEEDHELIYDGSKPLEKQKNVLTLIITGCAALMVLLIFFLLIRPLVIKTQAINAENALRVKWLEEELQKRAPEHNEIAGLLAEYQNWLQAGKPEGTTPGSGAETEETDSVQP